MMLAWGARVSAEFRSFVVTMAAALGCDSSYLMACMAFETGRTFSPSVKNPNSSATGLIQFMRATALDLGTTVEELADMTAEQQLRYVYAYFKPYAGRLNTLGDVYMAILWPAAVGKPDNYVLFQGGNAYAVNKGLDFNHDGAVTKAECTSVIERYLAEGLQTANVFAETPPVIGRETSAVEAGEVQQPEGSMDPLSLVSLLVSVFAPKIRAQADKALGTDVGAPLIDKLLGMAQQLTGKKDPLEAVAVARQDPAIVAKMEATTEDWFKQIAPAVDKIAALEKQEWDASETSMAAAADRGMRMQEAGPLKNNPQFLIALGILSMVGVVVMSVLWKDALIALFIGKEALGVNGVGFSTDMQAFVIGAIVGAALTAVIGYFFGSTRSSAAKDVTINAMANQQAKGGKA